MLASFPMSSQSSLPKMRPSLLLLPLLPGWAIAQFPPPQEGLTEVKSRFDNGITIKYKEVLSPSPPPRNRKLSRSQPGICETTPGVRSYSGFISLPPGTLADEEVNQNYTINTLFWFIESRNDPRTRRSIYG